MEKRLLIALLLAAIVIILSQKIFPSPTASRVAPRPSTRDSAPSEQAVPVRVSPPRARATVSAAMDSGPASVLRIGTSKAEYSIARQGAEVLRVALSDYKELPTRNAKVQLARSSTPLVDYQLLIGSDTLQVDSLTVFSSGDTGSSSIPRVVLAGQYAGAQIRIVYSFSPDGYVFHVSGSAVDLRGAPVRGLIVTLPEGLAPAEADTVDDQRNLAFVVKPVSDGARSIAFRKLDTLSARVETGPLRWVASKNKYFLLALLTDSTQAPFSSASFIGVTRRGKTMTSADASVVVPVDKGGAFAFDIYAGPQEWRRLHALGRDFEHVNPYGGILRGVVEPFATLVMQVLLWMHDHLRMSYGWVVVIFGVGVRVLLWPLNQSAMRNSLKLQRVQPELQAVQKKYRSNPEKQYAEIQRVYREHGLSPLTPVAGCLPMLIPMPVLFALYFVFQNTIEFRGVPFLWIGDISQRDPLFVLPIVMGLSMFLLSWIGLRSSPPNPQAKMMAYVFPVMMVFFFWRLAAGLNLYYAVQNIAALPQQWLIAQERAKATPARVT